ncbi:MULTISPECIES: hypothetical protein [unclassified Pedobacter]|uniref:hypothetical protein n=1 Tax=unclassified Pedobacter TaxID=2628915 RepID=UPI001420DAA2|nr:MULTISPECIES: hypothetical protein [unclassified Pedobacter]NII81757.1 hypothetical protein [Pedobacter sp. SG908]NMN35759.1 hypothetical protein [Pedobacter sp. SG918]
MPQFQLEIKRVGVTKATVEIDESTIYNGEFMGMDKITTSFITTAPIPIQLDDYIEYDAGKGLMPYKIKSAIGLEEIDSKTYKYDITFFSPTYDMYDEIMIHLGRTKFSYTGTPLELLGLIVDCMNIDNPGWSIGDCSLISEPIAFAFDEQSPRIALTQVAEAFKLEYKIVGKEISLIEKVGTLQNITLRYGRGQGLTNSARQSVDESFATVWRGYGGTQNILPSYRDGMDRLALDAPFEINVDKYGRKKGSVTFEDIYPRRTSTLTSVAGLLEFSDDTIDFDLNAQTKTDGGAKIVFKSGELAGGEYVISSYNAITKTMRIRANKDDAGNPIPNATFSPAVGDKYTLIGITMPESYFVSAHAELQAALENHAKSHSFPPVAFPLNIDEKYIREMGLTRKLVPGDSLTVVSESLGVNTPLRLQSVSWPLVNPDLITGVISDVIQYSTQERLINDVKDGKKEIAKSVAVALNTRQIADEISNNAILDQFRKTYVGDRVVMTGAFVAGNPEIGEVAGINGADDDLNAIRFWAGSSYADKETAPFRVNQRGDMVSTSGKIAGFDINEEGLTNEQSNAFIALKKIIGTMQIGGAFGIGVPSDFFGSDTVSAKSVLKIVNTIDEIPGEDNPNIGIQLDVANGNTNLAIDIIRGLFSLRKGSNIIVQKDDDSLALGIGDFEADVRVGGSGFVKMRWVKGILISAVPV